MNVPNSITLGRIALTIAYAISATLAGHGAAIWALALFCTAAATDWLDGYFARRLNQVTTLGKLLDPLVDKILTGAGFVHLAVVGYCPIWVVALIFMREYFVTGLRQLAIERGEVLAADKLGKWKTTFQMLFLIIGLFSLAWGDKFNSQSPVPLTLSWLQPTLLWIALGLTLISGFNYLWSGRALLKYANTS